ncbi:Fic/DOC family protein [Larkinella rosea]|uniref:protein adenylyltransferase n=1 Tax=Larkinella rosea TaxID=2025312 RepID=A0A3P1BDV6_9BACT|nr:Fic family protein [Larkinella rosea]RRA99111.1 cell filamentation protein Fic [Larkinella rosea]
MKYQIPYDQNEQLPNRLNLKSTEAIGLAEFEGFLSAEIRLTEQLTSRTRFTCQYIRKMHKLALGHLYGFAGKWRDVNLSKGGFVFAAAHFLPNSMQSLETAVLASLPNRYATHEQLVHDLAVVHAELLFIHPFREGNGRTARLLANLMCRKQGLNSLRWEKIEPNEGAEISFTSYIHAVQQAAGQNYEPMKTIIQAIWPA